MANFPCHNIPTKFSAGVFVMDRLPQFGEWLLSNNLWDPDPPFAVLRVNFNSMTGTARYLHHTVHLTRLARIAKDKFGAAYHIGSHNGLLEAKYNDDQTLSIKFIGNPNTTCTARPTELVGGERPISQWSTTERLREAINRSLPKLPADVAHEIKAMLTPQALAIMAGALALWGVSHFFGVGEIVDVIMLVTGAVLMGTVAADVGGHLGNFGALVVRGKTDADLDAAADHFAKAVSKGGVQVVFAILLYKGGKALPKRAGPPVRQGELPTELNAVAETEIPPTSRAPVAPAVIQGEQPALPSVTRNVAERALALLNRIRRRDLASETDCWGECMNLMEVAGGEVIEGNATSRITRFDHTMWRIGNMYVDTRPGMWIKHFRENPGIAEALERVVPGIVARLERGAVLTIRQFELFRGNNPPPASPMFSTDPIPAPGR